MNMLSNLIRMILKKKKVRPWACSLKRELELECVMLHKKKRGLECLCFAFDLMGH